MKTYLIICIIASIGLLSGCSHSKQSAATPSSVVPTAVTATAPSIISDSKETIIEGKTTDHALLLKGSWQLNYIASTSESMKELYPRKTPLLIFDVQNWKISGNTGCNNIQGQVVVDGQKMLFPDAVAMTRMMCNTDGEEIFLRTLKRVNGYSITGGNTLNLLMGDIALMRLSKQ